MELSSDVLEFIRLLNKRKAKYLIVGGWAVALHGRPRYTKDIDILVHRSPENAEALLQVIADFGFSELNIKKEDFLKPGYVIQLGFEPNRIDLITSIIGVDFEELLPNKAVIDYQGVSLSFIGAEDLITNKGQAGRPQDLADVATLRQILSKE